MAKYVLLLEYSGANYCGWQIQKEGVKTVQGELDAALSSFANHQISTITAGRTDTGVHALHQVVHFHSDANRKLSGWVDGINSKLPKDIRIKDALEVSDDFDVRFSAISRTYHYYLLIKPQNSAILSPFIGWYYQDLDLEGMQLAANMLHGLHDFSSFRAAGCQANTPTREMHLLEIDKKGDVFRFKLKANAFLHHMVRNIVGALLYVGNGKISLAEFEEIFKSKDRKKAPPTFMPNGLYLADVEYPQKLFTQNEDVWLFNL